MKVLMFLAAILVVSQARSLRLRSPACSQLLAAQGYSANFNETIAHAIHSMTVEGLQLFNVKATERNSVPTVNMDRSSAQKVVPFAPLYPLGNDFKTREMNVVDKILSEIGNAHDGLGPNWSPVERIAHTFHMWDLWHRILDVYQSRVMSDPPTDTVCQCLLDVRNNGIYEVICCHGDVKLVLSVGCKLGVQSL